MTAFSGFLSKERGSKSQVHVTSKKREVLGRITRSRSREIGKDFYRLAAVIAKPDLDDETPSGSKNSFEVVRDLINSLFLESSYQEKSRIFVAQNTSWSALEKDPIKIVNALEKWRTVVKTTVDDLRTMMKPTHKNSKHCCLLALTPPKKSVEKNSVLFTKEDLSMLLSTTCCEIFQALNESYDAQTAQPINAITFHEALSDLVMKETWPPVIYGTFHGTEQKIFVAAFRIFSSHRLRMKSLQKNTGAEPCVRYFHAAIRSLDQERFDVVYWLRFDEEQKLVNGDYVREPISQLLIPAKIWGAHAMIERICQIEKHPLRISVSKTREAILALLKLYLESI